MTCDITFMLRVNKGVKALISQGFFQGSCVAVARPELGLGAPGAFEKKSTAVPFKEQRASFL
jgi:hypothetical protein